MVINGIETADISVVVQGAVSADITPLCLKSVREFLPEAEIILSTWEGSRTDGMDFDQLVCTPDPGAYDLVNLEFSNKCNVDRQIVSTIEGLKRSRRKYAVKLRSDFLLRSADFLKWFKKYPKSNEQYSFFQQKIIGCELFSRNPRILDSGSAYALHPSDIFFFGQTEDLLDLFSIPLTSEEDKFYFADRLMDAGILLARFVPEQYLWYYWLRKHLQDDLLQDVDRTSMTPELITLTEATFASNLILLSNHQIGLVCAKPEVFAPYKLPENCMEHVEWECLYRYYCENDTKSYQKYLDRINQKNERGMPEEKNAYVVSCFDQPVTAADISVVLQGPVYPQTGQHIEEIRAILPGAEIVVSTWEGEETDNLGADRVVLSPDPGSSGIIREFPFRQIHNVNRIIVSSAAGVKAATREYCLKMRSDMTLVSDNFLTYYNRYAHFLGQKAFVSRRVMVEGLHSTERLCFDISDWYAFGLRQDILRWFNVDLYPYENMPYFNTEEHKNEKPFMGSFVCQYIPEQYIIYRIIKKYSAPRVSSRLSFAHVYDNTPQNAEIFRQFLAENILPLENTESGIVLSGKEYTKGPDSYANTICFSRWLELCKDKYTLPPELLDDPAASMRLMEKRTEYGRNPRYYNIKNYSAIIGDFAKIETVALPDDPVTQEELTFVVTGRVTMDGEYNTHRCLESIRRFFPGSKIILSTWKGENVDPIRSMCDEILLHEPLLELEIKYFLKSVPDSRFSNINKQQYCVNAGLKRVTTKYAARIRSDFYFYNRSLLKFFAQAAKMLNKADSQYQIFQRHILVSERYTHDPRKMYAYQLSDCFQLGLTEDLLRLWDGHAEPEEELDWFERPHQIQWSNPRNQNSRYSMEQCLFLNTVKKAGLDVQLPEWYADCRSDRMIYQYEKVLASNVIVGAHTSIGIRSKFDGNSPDELLTFERCLELYLYNIDPKSEICLEWLKEHLAPTPASTLETVPEPESEASFRDEPIVKSKADRGKEYLKKLTRMFSPAYRAICGTRERLQAFEERDEENKRINAQRFDELVSRQNALMDAIQSQGWEIRAAAQRYVAAACLHPTTFVGYRNKHQGQDVVLCGAGPTLNYYEPHEGAVFAAINRAFLLESVKFDYVISIDFRGIEDFQDELAGYEREHCVKLFSCPEGRDQFPESFVSRCGAVRFYTDALLKPNGSWLVKADRFTADIMREPIGNFFSSVFPAMQILLYTNPKRIYLAGCDMSGNLHFDGTKLNDPISGNENPYVIKAWHDLKAFAAFHYPDTEIISVNPVGLKGLFRDEYTPGYLEALKSGEFGGGCITP